MDIIDTTPKTPRQVFDASVEIASNVQDPRPLNPHLGELNRYIHSPIGTKQLQELHELQKHIPMTNRWQVQESNLKETTPAAIEKLNEEMAKRHPQKLRLILFVKSSPDEKKEFNNLRSGYARVPHQLVLSLPASHHAPYATRNPSTDEIVFRELTFGEAMAHEMAHALIRLRTKYGKGEEPSLPCNEEQATAAERGYTEYLNANAPKDKQLPLRRLYVDADAMLKHQLDEAARAKPLGLYNIFRMIGVPHKYRSVPVVMRDLTPQQLEPYIERAGIGVFLDSGCTSVTDRDLMRRTRELLNNNGLNNEAVNDADMQRLILQKVKKELNSRGIEQ